MAVTKIWKITNNLGKVINYSENGKKTRRSSLDDILDYAMNKDKTEKQFFVTGINCDARIASDEMNLVKLQYNKTDGIHGFHAYQSFEETKKETNLTPEIAHEIGVKLANQLWGDRFQVVVTTHLNTGHLHNHFVINSVSFKDGKRFYDNKSSYGYMRHESDELCKEYGLKTREEKPTKAGINYDNFYKNYERIYNTEASRAKRDLDFAIRQAFSYKEFINIMNKMDYEVTERYEKLSIRHKNYKRNIRIERRFGDDYTIENIKKRILSEQDVRIPFIEEYNKPFKHDFTLSKRKIKVKGFMAIYFHYMYLLRLNNKNPYIKLTPEMKADIAKMDKYSEEAKLLANNKIETSSDLESYYIKKNGELKLALGERGILWDRRASKKNEDIRQELCNQISEKTEIINRLRKEVVLCEDIKTRIPKMKENLNELKKEEKAREKEQKLKKDKRKEQYL